MKDVIRCPSLCKSGPHSAQVLPWEFSESEAARAPPLALASRHLLLPNCCSPCCFNLLPGITSVSVASTAGNPFWEVFLCRTTSCDITSDTVRMVLQGVVLLLLELMPQEAGRMAAEEAGRQAGRQLLVHSHQDPVRSGTLLMSAGAEK